MLKTSIIFLAILFNSSLFASGVYSNGVGFSGDWVKEQIWHPGMFLGVGEYYVYIPKNLPPRGNRALVVMLHGCMQNPESFAQGTKMNLAADKEGFIVLYPKQSDTANKYFCWNWFLPINTIQSPVMIAHNEQGVVLGMIESTLSAYGIDRDQVFLAGISAGASMISNLLNCYPEKFKAAGIHHGVQYLGASDVWYSMEKLTEIVVGQSPLSPRANAKKGYQASGNIPDGGVNTDHRIKAIIFHGDKGPMHFMHSIQVVEELMYFNEYLDNSVDDNSLEYVEESVSYEETKLYAYDRHIYSSGDDIHFERYLIYGLGHAWSGGDNSFDFNDPHGPDATKLMINFFKRNGMVTINE